MTECRELIIAQKIFLCKENWKNVVVFLIIYVKSYLDDYIELVGDPYENTKPGKAKTESVHS